MASRIPAVAIVTGVARDLALGIPQRQSPVHGCSHCCCCGCCYYYDYSDRMNSIPPEGANPLAPRLNRNLLKLSSQSIPDDQARDTELKEVVRADLGMPILLLQHTAGSAEMTEL